MTSTVALAKPQGLANMFPGRWWVPTSDDLEALGPKCFVKTRLVVIEPDGSADPWSTTPIWMEVQKADGDQFEGRITTSSLFREGYREGDTLRLCLDEVFDFYSTGPDGRPALNVPRANFMLGKTILIGVTTETVSGDLVSQDQYVGRLASVDPQKWLHIQVVDGSDFYLPPDVRAFDEARPGSYRLRATGVVVTDPHLHHDVDTAVTR